MRLCILATTLCLMLLPGWCLAGSDAGDRVPPGPCPHAAPLPARPPEAPTGREFARRILESSGPEREEQILAQLEQGNIPAFLRHLIPVTMEGRTARGTPARITVCVLPDYLAVGSDSDFLYVPLGLRAALQVAWRHGYVLPTPRIVDAIYAASTVKLKPEPLPASDQMRSTAYVMRHTDLIDLQRALHLEAPGALTAGDKKDVVLTEQLWRIPGRVAIYGWHRALGDPIQPLSTVHGARYVDYSHGVRLVSRTVYVNGVPRRMDDVLADRNLAPVLSGEGPLRDLARRLAALVASLRS
jgi:hypothetical protein